MTYDEEGGMVPKLKQRIEEDTKGNYVILRESEEGFDGAGGAQSPSIGIGVRRWWWSVWWWVKLVLLLSFLGILVAVFIKWVGPFFMEKVFLLNLLCSTGDEFHIFYASI